MRSFALLAVVISLVVVGCEPMAPTPTMPPSTTTAPMPEPTVLPPAVTNDPTPPTINPTPVGPAPVDPANPSLTPPTTTPPAPPAPDNTKVNERDADGRTKTPIDQDENPDDIKRTADIRKRVLDQPDMSINARNVKIITSKGKVTLRGPVNSEAERDTIVRIAKEVAGETNVDNQLEVAKP